MKRGSIAAFLAALTLLSGVACSSGGTESEPPAQNTGQTVQDVTGPGLSDPGGMVNRAENSVQDSVNKVTEDFNNSIP